MQTDDKANPAGGDAGFFDTEYTNFAVCPYYGHEENDSWEIDTGPGYEGDAETMCKSCGEDYFVSRHCTITYTTRKLKPNAKASREP